MCGSLTTKPSYVLLSDDIGVPASLMVLECLEQWCSKLAVRLSLHASWTSKGHRLGRGALHNDRCHGAIIHLHRPEEPHFISCRRDAVLPYMSPSLQCVMCTKYTVRIVQAVCPVHASLLVKCKYARSHCLVFVTSAEVQADKHVARAQALANRARGVKDAVAIVCGSMRALAADEAALASAISAFCKDADEESVQMGCPLLKHFATLFQGLQREQAQLAEQMRTALVTTIDSEMEQSLHLMHAAQRRARKTAVQGSSSLQLGLPGHRRTASLSSAEQETTPGSPAHAELATSIQAWECKKEHVFLGAFAQGAHALRQFYDHGAARMRSMDAHVEDMQRAQHAALAREVRRLHQPETACIVSIACAVCFVVALGVLLLTPWYVAGSPHV